MAALSVDQQQAYAMRQARLTNGMRWIGETMLAYWAPALTLFLGLLVCAALSVPFLLYLGLNDLARPLFFTLHLICAQIPSHSFYLLGHQLGMCARNMSIYSSMFLGSLIFVLSKKRLPGIPWWIWMLMILPMACDGLTQMAGLRESSWQLRVLSGTIFGLGMIWFVLPLVQRMMLEALGNPQPEDMTRSTLNIPPALSAQHPALPDITGQETPRPLSCDDTNGRGEQPEAAQSDDDSTLHMAPETYQG